MIVSKEHGGLASGWWVLALTGLFFFVFAVVALSGPGRIDIVDGQTRYEVARSLVDHGDHIIRDPDVWFAVRPGRDGQRYTDYRFPQTVLGVGAILAADVTGPVNEMRRHFFFTLISPFAAAVLAVTYSLWFRGLGHCPGASLFWATAGIFCTPSWYYGTSTFDDILGTLAIVLAVAVMWLSRDRRPLLGATVAGLVMGWAFNCKPPLGFFALPVVTAGYRPGQPLRQQLTQAGLVFFGLALGVVAYKAYDLYKFPPGTPNPYLEYEEWYGPMWTSNPIPGLANLALSPSAGAFWYCPPLLLSCLGWLEWCHNYRRFCWTVLAASLMFTLFLCFLTFFKGEPSWGPRYLTPVFALGWVFVPAAVGKLHRAVVASVLTVGVLVQLLGLSIDPQRLFLQTPISLTYYYDHPWLGFNLSAAHLPRRCWEIVEVLTPRQERAPDFNPAPLPTHAGGINAPGPILLTSLIGLSGTSPGAGPLSATCSTRPALIVLMTTTYREAAQRYHVFSSLRPWWISQQYLPVEKRPVDLPRTATLLGLTMSLGFLLLILGCWRVSRPAACGPCQAAVSYEPAALLEASES
ncbi:MAG TPA: hypothetical protein VNK04_16755 [Gemmataceae bacterium]|nr:hypothetical protein [Gemmataceae bacterium]